MNIKQLEAQLELAKAEEALTKAKGTKTPEAKLRDLKDDVRAKRQAYREAYPAGSGEGTTVTPNAIKAGAEVRVG